MVPWPSRAQWAPPSEWLKRDAGLAVGQRYGHKEGAVFKAPHEARRRSAGCGALPFWVWQLPTVPSALPRFQAVLGQLRRKERPKRKRADFLLIRHMGTDLITMHAPLHSDYDTIQP